jgi:hypothetical protein
MSFLWFGQLRHRPTDKQKGMMFSDSELWLGAMFHTTGRIMPYIMMNCCDAERKTGASPR